MRSASLLLFLLTFSLVPHATGCGASADKQRPQLRVSGQIENFEVEDGSLKAILVRDSNGDSQLFRVSQTRRPRVSLTHLQFHREVQEPVTLQLTQEGESVVVIRIDDYLSPELE
jgi:hypothetical protein